MAMAIDSSRATKKGQKTNTKDTMSVSIDSELKKEFTGHCHDNNLKYAPIVEDLIEQYMEEVRPKKKGK